MLKVLLSVLLKECTLKGGKSQLPWEPFFPVVGDLTSEGLCTRKPTGSHKTDCLVSRGEKSTNVYPFSLSVL